MTGQEQQKSGAKKARFIDPPNILRQKIGYGGIEPMRLQRGEDFITENELDFLPYARRLMDRLDEILIDCRSGRIKGEEAVDELTKPIMELKANGGMFKYSLMTEIADIILNFLENISELNKDVYEIVDAHQNALQVIITSELKGTGGKDGRVLAEELYRACKRYYKKHGVQPRG